MQGIVREVKSSGAFDLKVKRLQEMEDNARARNDNERADAIKAKRIRLEDSFLDSL